VAGISTQLQPYFHPIYAVLRDGCDLFFIYFVVVLPLNGATADNMERSGAFHHGV
jgi:hypothetical protein